MLDPRVLFAMAVCVAIAFLGLNEYAYQGARKAAETDYGLQEHRTALYKLTQSLFIAQASLRSYLLSDDESLLEQHRQALQSLSSDIEQLELAAMEQGLDREAALELRDEVVYQITEMELALRLYQQNRMEALEFLLSSDRSSGLFQRPATLSQQLLAYQDDKKMQSRETLQGFLGISRVGVALLTLVALVAFWLYLRQISARKAEDMLVQKHLERERDALERLVRQRTASLSELASYLQQVREHERSHLANELHDELGALLTAAKLDIARLRPRIDMKNEVIAERVAHLTETLNQVIALKRRIVEDLRPSSLNTLGLNAALDNLLQEFSRRTELQIQSDHEDLDLGDRNLELTVYRIVQEALTNISKYAKASTVKTIVHRYPKHLLVSISDDGQGFEPDSVSTATHGIRGMRHRVEALGGQLVVESRPGAGTTVQATIPLPAVNTEAAAPAAAASHPA
ncbi:hypothetical protein AAV94_00225 [Lampropedia cohaerens]|uniref:histidine kinase n=2 Tax=Lampropedia cohaerens TaxID=1610491 RepID=A0A0U1Q3Q1_9BURK|nr:hypothetical protein AAV94_00225 [Lampropedia cohaerens]